MEPRSWAVVDAVEERGEELRSVVLVVVGGVIALLAEDGHELGPGLEEAAAFADALEARADAQLVMLFWRGALIKVHPRQPAGGRATDPADLPKGRATYALRDIGHLCRQADTHGGSVGVYARRLLEVDLPWTRMRQVYRLLGYARRYGDGRTDTACAQALALDVVDVGLIGRILERGREHTRPPDPPVAQPLPLRFARHQEPAR